MLPKRPNIWRVYMDLMANFMGLVLIGGAGLMLMVGGAVVHASAGPAAFAKRCKGGGWVEKGDLLMAVDDLGRSALPNVEDCTIKASYQQVVFESKQSQTAPEVIRQNVCKDVYDAVRFVKQRGVEGAGIEIVGQTSGEYENRSMCQSQYLALVRACASCTPQELQSIIGAFATPGQTTADISLCNAPVAADRAVWARRVCVEWASAPDRPPDAPAPEDVARVTVSGEPVFPGAEACPASQPHCHRTVSVRMRLPANPSVRRKAAS